MIGPRVKKIQLLESGFVKVKRSSNNICVRLFTFVPYFYLLYHKGRQRHPLFMHNMHQSEPRNQSMMCTLLQELITCINYKITRQTSKAFTNIPVQT